MGSAVSTPKSPKPDESAKSRRASIRASRRGSIRGSVRISTDRGY